MSGVSVAMGIEVKKPENCGKCQRRQCDITCRDLPNYQKWEASQKKSSTMEDR